MTPLIQYLYQSLFIFVERTKYTDNARIQSINTDCNVSLYEVIVHTYQILKNYFLCQ